MWTDFWTFLTPLPPLWTILLNKAYVVTWTFGKLPLPPAMSTWFMNTPYDDSKKVFQIFESYTFLKPKNDETSILVSRDQNLLAQTCIYYLMVARVIVSKKAFNFIAHRHSYRPLFQLNDLIKA